MIQDFSREISSMFGKIGGGLRFSHTKTVCEWVGEKGLDMLRRETRNILVRRCWVWRWHSGGLEARNPKQVGTSGSCSKKAGRASQRLKSDVTLTVFQWDGETESAACLTVTVKI